MAGSAELPTGLANPARRALQNAGIDNLEQLSSLTEKELMAMHGIGVSARRCIKAALMSRGLSLRTEPSA